MSWGRISMSLASPEWWQANDLKWVIWYSYHLLFLIYCFPDPTVDSRFRGNDRMGLPIRRQTSTAPPVIPAKAGIHRSPDWRVDSRFHAPCHSCESRNPSLPDWRVPAHPHPSYPNPFFIIIPDVIQVKNFQNLHRGQFPSRRPVIFSGHAGNHKWMSHNNERPAASFSHTISSHHPISWISSALSDGQEAKMFLLEGFEHRIFTH